MSSAVLIDPSDAPAPIASSATSRVAVTSSEQTFLLLKSQIAAELQEIQEQRVQLARERQVRV